MAGSRFVQQQSSVALDSSCAEFMGTQRGHSEVHLCPVTERDLLNNWTPWNNRWGICLTYLWEWSGFTHLRVVIYKLKIHESLLCSLQQVLEYLGLATLSCANQNQKLNGFPMSRTHLFSLGFKSGSVVQYSPAMHKALALIPSTLKQTNKQTKFRHRHGGTDSTSGRCLDSHSIRQPKLGLKYSVCCQFRLHCGSAWRRSKVPLTISLLGSSLGWPMKIIHGSGCGKLLQTHRSQEVQTVFFKNVRETAQVIKSLHSLQATSEKMSLQRQCGWGRHVVWHVPLIPAGWRQR